MPDAPVEDIHVVNNEADGQFEIHIGDEIALLAYDRDGGTIAYLHTEVPKQLEGRGIASRLASYALDYARAEGLKVVPLCPYVASYIERNPQYQDLLAPRERWREFLSGRA